MKQEMNVVYICDENYAMPAAVSIVSLRDNRNAGVAYCVHVVCCGVSQDSRAKLQSLSCDGFSVVIHEVTLPESYSRQKNARLHVSPASLFKFELGELFPELDRILYLDCDTLVGGDISELFSCDISGCYAAAVKDMKAELSAPTQLSRIKAGHKTGYFNSGVMLLDLELLRRDRMNERLLQQRLDGTNFFMDQDAFNFCFGGRVKYLPFGCNYMTSVIGAFSDEEIKEFYNCDIAAENALVLHLCSKYKPWDHSNVPFADKWYGCYKRSPFSTGSLLRTVLKSGRDIFISRAPETPRAQRSITVSLTSYPARIAAVHLAVRSLLHQTMKADRVILWLAREQFPRGEEDLPKELTALVGEGLTISWCEDLGPHKKYFYAMQQYPEDIIITADDDMEYQPELIETLYRCYRAFPYAVCCMRAHGIRFGADKSIAPYSQWERDSTRVYIPSMSLMATGVGGVLYPPHCMSDELFNKEQFMSLCPSADDLWLKVMQVMSLTPTVIAGSMPEDSQIAGTQDTALWRSNDKKSGNDRQLNAILSVYNEYYGASDTLISRMEQDEPESLDSAYAAERAAARIEALESRSDRLEKEIENIRASWTYRLGRAVTFIPRKIRGLLHRPDKVRQNGGNK